MLSVGKVITWSGPAIAIGGFYFPLQPSQDVSFLQALIIAKPVKKMQRKYFN
jgi:hypothetical protein